MNPALYQLLDKHYRSKRLGLLILVGICAVAILVVIGWGVADLVGDPAHCGSPRSRFYASCADRYYSQAMTRTAVLSIPCLILIVIGGVGVIPILDLAKAPLIRAFTSRREEIAWLYPKRTSVRRYGVEVNQIHEVVVGMTDGKRHNLTMTEQEVQTTLRLMAAEAPHAATGYSPELDMQFRMNPRNVMKSGPAVAAAAARATAPSARMVVAPDVPFARIDQGIRYLGFAPDAPPAPAPIPGEVAQAAWSGKGMRVAYTFDPRLYLRVIEVFGGDPLQLRNELASVVNVPVLGPQQVTGMLASPDPRALLLGLHAAEVAGSAADERRAYQDLVMRLQGHPDPMVAQAAQRVYGGWV